MIRIFIFALFTACFWVKGHYPPLADEVVFLKPLKIWIDSGPARWGVWHTPFYPWALAFLGKHFGLSPFSFRWVGFFSVLGAALLIDRSAVRLLPRFHSRDRLALWAMSLLQPIALGSALLIDYDNTVLVLATAWFFYVLLKGERRVWALGLAFSFCMMAKENTPLIYPLAIWATHRSFKLAVTSALIGLAIFSGLTFAWCAFYGIPFSTVFEMTVLGLKVANTAGTAAQMDWVRSAWIKLSPAFWIGIPIVLLLVGQWRKFAKFRGPLLGVVSVVLGVVLVYTFVLRQMTYHFPKYMAPVLIWIPYLLMATGASLATVSRPWIAGVVAFGWFAPDPLEIIHQRSLSALPQALLFYGIPFLAWSGLRFLKKSSLPLASLALLLNLALCSAYVHAALFRDHAITYWYGETASTDALKFVKEIPPGTMIYSSAEDLAYTIGARFYPTWDLRNKTSDICDQSLGRTALVSRVRESTSILTSRDLAAYRSCLHVRQIGPDLVVGD